MAKSKHVRKQTKKQGPSHRVFDDVIDVASTLLRNRKAPDTERLQCLAEATQNYASALTDLPTFQRQVKLASKNMENFAEYVLNTDIKHMVSDATVLARRRPIFTFGIAALAGFIAGG